LQIDHTFSDTFFYKGNALVIGKYQEAIPYLDKVLQENPNDVNTLYSKAVVLSSLGKYDEGMQYYNKLLQIDPNYVDKYR